MELLYSAGCTPVIVLPMEECIPADRSYISRGWCFLEFSLALSFNNIVNADLIPYVRVLCDGALEEETDTVQGFREAFAHKHFTYDGDTNRVLTLFEQTIAETF